MNFAIGDTNIANISSVCQMFCGLGVLNTSPLYSSSVSPSITQNILGIGCEVGDTGLYWYSKGASTTNPRVACSPSYSTLTPSSTWFNITFINQQNSNDITVILNGITAGVSTTESKTFSLNTATSILNTQLLYPIYVRAMAVAGGSTGSAQTLFQKFSLSLQ